jgi:hypothetical protein
MRHTLIIKDPEFQYMDGVAHRTSQLAGAGAPVHPKTYCSPVYRPAILLQLMILLVLLRRNSGFGEWHFIIGMDAVARRVNNRGCHKDHYLF